MKTYSKPIVTIDTGLAEGVYAASGCYDASAYIHQTPETGRGDYRIQVMENIMLITRKKHRL